MRKEYCLQQKQIDCLLNIENNLTDLSSYKRQITNKGAVVRDGYILVSNSQQFYVPYSNDICKWFSDGYTIEMDCFTERSISGHTGHGTFVCQGNNPGNIDYWSFGLLNQKLCFYYYNGNQISVIGTEIVPLNEWHNIKMKYSNGIITTYIDGNISTTAALKSTPQLSSSYKLVFMGYTANTNSVRLKNIKIYKE